MSARSFAGASIGVAAIVVVAAWLFEWPLEKAVYLAPVLVVAFAAAAGLVVLWTRIALDSLRRSRRPRFWIVLALAAIVVVGILSALGVELPREGY